MEVNLFITLCVHGNVDPAVFVDGGGEGHAFLPLSQ